MLALAAAANLAAAPVPLRSVLAAPLFYLLPLGIGLLLTESFFAAVTRTHRLLCAYLVGLIAICAIFVAREHWLPSRLSIDLCAGVIAAASLAGFWRSYHQLFRWDGRTRAAALELALVLPAFAIPYWLRFVVFSEYPVTDLFQATHVMKAALDFGRFDMLNPFTAGSYPPVNPVIEGLLFRYFGFEPLHGVWILSALSILPKFLALRAAMLPLLGARTPRVFAIAVTACFLPAVTPTNGELAMLGSLALLALVLREHEGPHPRHGASVALALVGFVIAYMAARAAPLVYLVVLGMACALPAIAHAWRQRAAVLAIVPLVIAVLPLHRSAMLFVPLGLGCAMILSLLRHWRGWALPAGRGVVMAAGLLTVTSGLAALMLLAWLVDHPDEELRGLGPYRWVVAKLLQSTVDGNPEILLGAGPKVALFELARAMSPSFVAIAIGITAYIAWRAGARAVAESQEARDAVIAWSLAVVLGCGLLLGIPFTYRGGFFIIVLLAIALAASTAEAARGRNAVRIDFALLAAAAVYCVVVIPLAYGCAPFASCARSPYGELAQPLLGALGSLALGATAAAIAWRRHETARQALVQTALVIVFALEFTASRTYFYPYAYGARAPASGVISHLSSTEIELAAQLRTEGPIVLISDPFTMANLRALTGLDSLITFSNLDTLPRDAMERYRSWLHATLQSPRICDGESPLSAIGGPLSAAELNYRLSRAVDPGRSGASVLREFGFRRAFLLTPDSATAVRPVEAMNHGWHAPALERLAERGDPLQFVLIVNRKTIDWARGDRVSYYPDVGPLDPESTAALRARCNTRVHDGRLVVVSLPMAGARGATRR